MPGEISSPSSHLVVLTTIGGEKEARGLIRGLVEDRVVACGTMVGATSIFRWEGAVTEESETLVLLKTRRERWHDLEAAVARRHPYDVPELLALPVEAGLDAYLNWVNRETSTVEASQG
jgi:periplasmic divalent cation tolerance protein